MCHIYREKSGTTPGGMKTISFQQVRSAPKIRPVVYKTYVILRAPLSHPAIEWQQSAMNLITPVSRERARAYYSVWHRICKNSHGLHMQLLTNTFLFTIIHGQHQWDDGSFRIISLTECLEALSEWQFGKQKRDTYFVWSWCTHTSVNDKCHCLRKFPRKKSVKSQYVYVDIDSYMYWDFTDFFLGNFLRQWHLTTLSSAQMEWDYGDFYVR